MHAVATAILEASLLPTHIHLPFKHKESPGHAQMYHAAVFLCLSGVYLQRYWLQARLTNFLLVSHTAPVVTLLRKPSWSAVLSSHHHLPPPRGWGLLPSQPASRKYIHSPHHHCFFPCRSLRWGQGLALGLSLHKQWACKRWLINTCAMK